MIFWRRHRAARTPAQRLLWPHAGWGLWAPGRAEPRALIPASLPEVRRHSISPSSVALAVKLLYMIFVKFMLTC